MNKFLSNCTSKFHVLSIMLIAFLNMSMTRVDDFGILTAADLDQELIESTGGPALRSSPDQEPYWESFNKWMCFPTEQVEAYCAEIDYGQESLPTLLASNGDMFYEFSTDPGPASDCEKNLRQWLDLLQGQQGFCVYSAYLQNVDENHELWIIDKVKSFRGVWSYRNVEKVAEDIGDQPLEE